jgi:hypothetical protein
MISKTPGFVQTATMLKHAFKEWAVICKALAEGYQALILRKGGIEEIAGEFRLEHDRFWLFPTYTHQQATGIVSAALPMLERVEKQRPPADIVRLSHYAEVADVFRITELGQALALGGMHFWSDETVRQRFHYRRPGLFAITVRAFQVPKPFELANTPDYEGCRSWVELDRELVTERAIAVIAEEKFQEVRRLIRSALAKMPL